MKTRREISAGILLYRWKKRRLEFLIGHPGGPYYTRRNHACWSIPKGNVDPGEDLKAAALREFEEEIGVAFHGELIPIGEVRYSSGKTVHGYAGEWIDGELPPLNSKSFEMEWPPKSGLIAEFPEFDRIGFFGLYEAEKRIIPAQKVLLHRLKEMVESGGSVA